MNIGAASWLSVQDFLFQDEGSIPSGSTIL